MDRAHRCRGGRGHLISRPQQDRGGGRGPRRLEEGQQHRLHLRDRRCKPLIDIRLFLSGGGLGWQSKLRRRPGHVCLVGWRADGARAAGEPRPVRRRSRPARPDLGHLPPGVLALRGLRVAARPERVLPGSGHGHLPGDGRRIRLPAVGDDPAPQRHLRAAVPVRFGARAGRWQEGRRYGCR